MNLNHLLISFVIFTVYVANLVAHEAIIKGTLSRINQFLYQVSIHLDGKPTCGGGILDHQHILTAAHCVLSEHNNFVGSAVTVLAGIKNLKNTTSPRIVYAETAKIYVPMEFNPASADYNADIAVLKLKNLLQFHKNQLASLRLPETEDEKFVHRVARIAGFGRSELNEPGSPGVPRDGRLRWAEVNVIDNEQCQLEHQYRPITERQLCARVHQPSNEHRGVCHGDDGSPLVINSLVIGVLSLFPGSCTERIRAGIYTRVSHYKDFIDHAVNDIPHKGIRTLELHH